MGAGLQMQIPTGLGGGVRGLPQRVGEGHGAQDEPISSVEATWKYRPSIARPSGRQGNPGKVEVTVHSGSVSCVRTGPVPSGPCNPEPRPTFPAERPPRPPRGSEAGAARAAPARWAASPERDKVSGGEPSSHTSQPSATHTLMLTTFQKDFLSVSQRSRCGPKPAADVSSVSLLVLLEKCEADVNT